jgi:hypothetical protein
MKFVSKRSHPRELAGVKEIKAMMKIEAQRNPVNDKHFPEYVVAKRWLEKLNIESKIFGLSSIEEVSLEAERIKPLVNQRTLELTNKQVLFEVENYLGEEDKLEKVDVAIVFGGKTLSRAEKAAEMYLGGWAKKLLMTGKGPMYKGVFKEPEAVIFKNRDKELGVPEKDVITEITAINIPSNVRASLNLLDEMNIKYDSVMQIISWYANRRAWVVLKKYLPENVKIIRVNPVLPLNDGKINGYDKGEWFKTDEGIEIVFNEFVKMKIQEITNTS